MTFDPTSVEVTCVTLPKDHCVQVPWEYINVCWYSDQFCKIPHTMLHTTYIHTTYYRQNEYHIVSSVQARQKKCHYCFQSLTIDNDATRRQTPSVLLGPNLSELEPANIWRKDYDVNVLIGIQNFSHRCLPYSIYNKCPGRLSKTFLFSKLKEYYSGLYLYVCWYASNRSIYRVSQKNCNNNEGENKR